MPVTRQSLLMGVLSALLIFFAAGCMEPAPRHDKYTAARQGKMHIWYAGTSGKVGHHMYAQPKAYCAPGSATWQGYARLYGGSLPPGLRMKGTRISGVPTTPGRYQVTVKFTSVKCKGVKQRDRYVKVPFYITGIAAQRLD